MDSRRTFLRKIGLFSILAPATTYERIWKAAAKIEPVHKYITVSSTTGKLNPAWINAEYEIKWLSWGEEIKPFPPGMGNTIRYIER
jgi:hypothetical protein